MDDSLNIAMVKIKLSNIVIGIFIDGIVTNDLDLVISQTIFHCIIHVIIVLMILLKN